MNMKLLVLFLAFVAVLSYVKGNKPVWVDEAANGAHQNALKHLKNINADFYDMVKATYKNDPVWGNNFRCMYAWFDSFYENEKSIDAMFMFIDNDDGIYKTSQEKATAVKMYGYSKENGITYYTEDGQGFTDVLAYSDDNCFVVYALGAGEDGEGYELWAKNFKKVPTSCLEKFNEYAAGLPVRSVYTSDCSPTRDE